MSELSLNAKRKEDIAKKLEEHIDGILQKPVLSLEEAAVLKQELAKLDFEDEKAIQKLKKGEHGEPFSVWFFVILMLLFSGIGGEYNGL